MKILFDHQTFSLQDYGGISRYFIEIIIRINQRKKNAALSLIFSNNIYLRYSNFNIRSFFCNVKFKKKVPLMYRVNRAYSILSMYTTKFDIFHATYYDPYFLPYLNGIPFVITIHDMIFEKFFKDFEDEEKTIQLIENKRILAESATAIIAVSQCTKQDIIDILKIDANKIHVIYHGNSLNFTNMSLNKLTKPYLLYVGNRGKYKNFRNLIQAIAPLLIRYNIVLICAGGGKLDIEEQQLIQNLGITDYVEQQSVDSDQMLAHLYKSARAFVFPSLYEGFGIPILEAFACQCACVVSNTSSLAEIAGEAALYFDPSKKESISTAVDRILYDDRLREKLILAGNFRIKSFSWEKTANETIAVYESCLEVHNKK